MSVIGKMTSHDDDINFPRLWRYALVLSLVAVVVSVGSLVGRGLNLGIDFEGGTVWDVPAPGVSVNDARDALRPVGEGNAKIQIIGDDVLRVQAETAADDAENDKVTDALAELAGVDRSEVAVSTVGPTWGEEISKKAQRALIYFFVIVTAYMWLRLEYKMAIAALLAVVHDILVCVGFYSVFQFEVTPATVVAFLTILGFSLYDTIVVFDKVVENSSRSGLAGRMTYSRMMSLSVNQVLMRSLNSTIVAVLPVVSMLVVGALVLGAVTLEEFAVALVVGLVSGAYSSIFIAAPIVAFLKEREPEHRATRRRLDGQTSRQTDAELVTVGGAPVDDDDAEPTSMSKPSRKASTTSTPALSGRAIPPRPRKKTKRR